MGMYNEDDNVPKELIGFDCPFDDSLEIRAANENELITKIKDQEERVDFEFGVKYPDVICDQDGTLLVESYRRVCENPKFNPETRTYSFGRETLTEFWEREKHRWFE